MKMFSVCAILVSALSSDLECDVDQNSLIQRALRVKDTNLVEALGQAAVGLSEALPDTASDFVSSFANELHSTLSKTKQDERAALLRRASHSTELTALVEAFANLPHETRSEVGKAAIVSGQLAGVYRELTVDEKQSLVTQLELTQDEQRLLLSQLSSVASVGDAPGDLASGYGVESTLQDKEKKTQHGRHTHKHIKHRDTNGKTTGYTTETTVMNKEGDEIAYQHRHSHGKNANGEWVTQTKYVRDGKEWHAHRHKSKRGQSETRTKSGKHEHSHAHSHSQQGRNTITSSSTETKTGSVSHGHTHGHTEVGAQNGGRGSTSTQTLTNNNGHNAHGHNTGVNRNSGVTVSVTSGQGGSSSSHSGGGHGGHGGHGGDDSDGKDGKAGSHNDD